MTAGSSIRQVERLDLSVADRPWPFAQERRAAIDAHFAALRARNPAVWNGRILLLCEHEFRGDVLRGVFLEADFAAFNAWRDWGQPAASIGDCFAAAALVGSDGGWLLGEMGLQTVNAGKVYFPCGTPDSGDVAGTRVDFDRSLARELTEETGFDVEEFERNAGWTVVEHGATLAVFKVLHAAQPAQALRRRVLEFLARQTRPQLAGIQIVRTAADFSSLMPPYVVDFLKHRWR